ncbi:MAG: calcium/sodium antiporter [Clostridia bacterium]|nr:calcium/sodium antiporter [Clostridia bacterium]
MPLYVSIPFIIIGFTLLVKGADWFVEGAAGIAKKLKIPALVIGLTIVAFGTSAPELAVSVTSAIQHATDISIGNVVGSNIVNILLILGVSALIHNLPVQKSSMHLDIPALIIFSALLVGLGVWGYALAWYDGLILLILMCVYMALLFWNARKEQREKLARGEVPIEEEKEEPRGKLQKWFAKMEEKTWFLVLLTLVGLACVVGGGTLLVDGARGLAEYFGVSERIIGLTVVAIGTSLPELVTSVVAAKKGETDIAVGNIIGSNIFNIALVAGAASLFYPLTFTVAGNLVDALVALGAAVLLLILILLSKKSLKKPAGAVMVLAFIAYYVYLFLV